MSSSEKPVQEATLLAIEHINASGGLLGRKLEPVLMDGASDPDEFARQAERLTQQEGVKVLFGCWTSASRKSVLPVLRRNNALLFYPLQYEGIEQSPNVVYTGATLNQQLVPGVKWAFDNLGKRFFLVGSDYVYPRVSNLVAATQIKGLGGEVVGEEYIPMGSDDVESLVEKIAESKPDVILSTINGGSNQAFFKALRAKGIKSTDIPTVSMSLTESLVQQMGVDDVVGDYSVKNYFADIDTEANKAFAHYRW